MTFFYGYVFMEKFHWHNGVVHFAIWFDDLLLWILIDGESFQWHNKMVHYAIWFDDILMWIFIHGEVWMT